MSYNVSICIICKAGKNILSSNIVLFMVNYELLSYSEMHYILLSSLGSLEWFFSFSMQNPTRMPWFYLAMNTVSTRRNLLNSLLYIVLAGDVEAAYSRCRPSTSHDIGS